uniref:Carboxylesterase type B domain-containing protein n=1 Tax=Mus musculus TaxID=10090 RepID=Q9D998_MOUSE|nr:unnamed protein product [Mus musculus]
MSSMVLFISITCLYVFSSFSVRTSTCLIVFSCFSLRTCNSLAVFSCISLSDLLKSFLMSSTIIMRYAFKSRSRFSGVLVCPGLGEVGVLGSDDDSGGPVYFYEFQHRPHCFQNSRPAFVKADHTDEIRFVFGGPFLKGDVVMFEEATEEEKLLSRKMMKYWANFARSGDPNGADLPPWPVYDENEQYLELDVNISTGRRLKDQRVEFWTDTLPLILSASKALLSPTFSLILLSLLSPVLLSAAS